MANSNMVHIGYKILLVPDEEQKQFIDNCINYTRYVYNWALNQEEEQYKRYINGLSEEKFLSEYTLNVRYKALREEKEFLQEIPYTSGRNAIKRAIRGYKRFFKGNAKHPKFKTKKDVKKQGISSYNTRSDRMHIKNNMLRVEGIPNKYIKLKYKTGIDDKLDGIKFCNPVIEKDNLGNYYIAYTVLEPKRKLDTPVKNNKIIGIDLNMTNRIVTSDGTIYKAPNVKKINKKIKRCQRKLSKDYKRHQEQEKANPGKDIPYSKRHEERLLNYRKACRKKSNIFKNFVYTSCKEIVKKNPEYGFVMEDIKVSDITKGRHYMHKQMHDSYFNMIQYRIKENCENYDIPLILAPKYYPSSSICSNCGFEHSIGRNEYFRCPKCGVKIQRDINASIVLEKYGYDYYKI